MLKDKYVVVTGSSRGLGKAIALDAARNGACVGINYLRNETGALQLRDQILELGAPEPILLQFDATQKGAIEGGINRFLATCPRIDGWVNNAARNLPGLLPTLSLDEIRTQLESALMGPILCCQAVIPNMLTEHSGAIINIGSITTDKVFRGQSVYAAAKGGIVSFSRALAVEYARKGIRVNCLQPGPVETDMFRQTDGLRSDKFVAEMPQGRMVDAQSIAAMAVFLLSDSALSITGSVINVDGGYSL
ncbi:MAG: SDR family oxidoreductase [bacterium]